jgi:hypothetical protein
MSCSSNEKLRISNPIPHTVKECNRCMEPINLGDEEWVYYCSKQDACIYHQSCWSDGLDDQIFFNVIRRLSVEISNEMGFDSAVLEEMK